MANKHLYIKRHPLNSEENIFTTKELSILIEGLFGQGNGGDAAVFLDNDRATFENIKRLDHDDYTLTIRHMGLTDYDIKYYEMFEEEFFNTNWLAWWDNYHEDEDEDNED